jgi:hypothetical protein
MANGTVPLAPGLLKSGTGKMNTFFEIAEVALILGLLFSVV